MSRIIINDALSGLRSLPSESVHTCVTSPPYYNLRNYDIEGQIGNENSVEEYIDRLTTVFCEVKRVLRPDGTLWIVIADSYAGSGKGRYANGETPFNILSEKQKSNKGACLGRLSKTNASNCKPKDLIGIPWLLAFALRENGWYLRSDIIWDKSGNVFPESVKDRCTKSHEYIFMFSKSSHYYFNADAIKEPVEASCRTRSHYNGKVIDAEKQTANSGVRNKRDVWHVNTCHYAGAHFATFPPELIRPCILAGSPLGGIVLDPFIGSGTTALVAAQEGREYIGIEIQPEYEKLILKRLARV